VRSGISAAGALGFDLVSGGAVDGYLRASELKRFVKTHALAPSGLEGNVCLRLVPEKAWRFSGVRRSLRSPRLRSTSQRTRIRARARPDGTHFASSITIAPAVSTAGPNRAGA
jgi:hypothetical protein